MKTFVSLTIVLICMLGAALLMANLSTERAAIQRLQQVTVVDMSDHCDGFKQGYKDGYCDEIMSCLEPIPPVCPLPNLGQTTYKHGYQVGFIKGYKETH